MNIAFTLLVILLIFFGEAFAIAAEMFGARSGGAGTILLKLFLVMIVSGAFLLMGYTLGYRHFQNIWIVSVISITSILIIEPVLAYMFFHQLPVKGALVGLILGVLGFLFTIFW